MAETDATNPDSTNSDVTLPAIAMLGAGSMGRAILGGLTAPAVTVDGGILVTTKSAATAAKLGGGVTAIAVEDDPNANRRAVDGAGVVIVAVKPWLVADVLDEVAETLADDAIVVSVAAGVTAAAMETRLPDGIAVVRAMPNTPAVVGLGVTGVSAGSRATKQQVALVSRVFGTVGEVVEVPEEKLDALSTISGSGPAYVFYLIEQLTATAIGKGFTPEEAATLVGGTFAGAAELLRRSGETPGELRRQVTSPNGTTERAVAVLEDAGLKGVFDRATDAALARARELAAG